MTTKDQERKALDQIREIVAALGSDSYLAIAFEGCFEIAEENIQNDFGCSMKQRAESAEKKAEALADQLRQTANLLTVRTEMLNRAGKDAEARILALKRRIVARDDLDCILTLIQAQTDRLQKKRDEAAAEIVDRAAEPGSREFQIAVKNHRQYCQWLDENLALSDRVKSACQAGTSQE